MRTRRNLFRTLPPLTFRRFCHFSSFRQVAFGFGAVDPGRHSFHVACIGLSSFGLAAFQCAAHSRRLLCRGGPGGVLSSFVFRVSNGDFKSHEVVGRASREPLRRLAPARDYARPTEVLQLALYLQIPVGCSAHLPTRWRPAGRCRPGREVSRVPDLQQKEN